MASPIHKDGWAWEIRPDSSWFQWKLGEIWTYRHLLLRMVRRDFLSHHQQTLLGPLWIVLQPIVVLFIYVLIFEKAVGLSTDGNNGTLFYLSGIIIWSLFSETFTATAFTFVQNGNLFGKVYFPRLLVPFSIVVLNYLRFLIQFALFLLLLFFIQPSFALNNPHLSLLAFVVTSLIVPLIGLGAGLVFSILTAKYRDLVNMMHLMTRLMMFATPVIYPLSIVEESFRVYLEFNPLTSLFELFRYGFLGSGTFDITSLAYSVIVMCVLLVIGTMTFNKFSSRLQDVV